MKTLCLLKLSVVLTVGTSSAIAVDFKKDVVPILEGHCVRCHNPKGTDFESGDTDVDLSTKAAAFEVASTIVPGNAEKSKLYSTTILPDDAKKLMPPRNKVTRSLARLTKEQTETLKQWITEGAPWPDGVSLIARKAEIQEGVNEPLLVAEIHKQITAKAHPETEADMKAYTADITGAEVNFEMMPVKSGTLKMGSSPNEIGRQSDEAPVHEVQLAAFWIGKCEVTWNEFELFMYPEEEKKVRALKKIDPGLNRITDAVTHPTQPYVEMSFGMGKEGYPAISMTQHAANKYCQWISAKTGEFYRLPTEAEWEYACRAGTTTAYSFGDDPAKLGEYAWFGKNSDFKYQKVGKKKPNPWGLHDMHGNVIEWVLDQYDPNYYGHSPSVNPWNKATKPYPHAARGGSWDDEDPSKLRSAGRRASDKTWKIQDPQLPKSIWYHTDAQFLGFRVVRPLKVPTADEMLAYWNSGVEKDDPKLIKANDGK